MRLSVGEARLLCRLMKKGTCSSVGLDKAAKHAVAVLVYTVNKKAFRISGRRLILFCDGGYRLNPYL